MSDIQKEKTDPTLRDRIHEIIFEADTPAGVIFDVTLLIAIVCSIVVLCFETVPGIGRPPNDGVARYQIGLLQTKTVRDDLELSTTQSAEVMALSLRFSELNDADLKKELTQILSQEQVDGLNLLEGQAGSHEVELFYLSWFFTFLFTIEYLLRVYCVKRPMRYIWSFWGIVDLLAFLPDYFMLIPAFGSSGFHSRGFSVIRSLRLLRVFRIFRLSWFQFEADDLANAIWKARAKIIVFLAVVMIVVTVVGTLMYEIENTISETSQFESIPDGIYWAIVTMTTVGFGDLVPTTIAGKFLSAMLILIGYSLIIVPTGFVSAEIMEAKKRANISTRSCASCVTEGHDQDAKYCKYCGEQL